MNATCTLHAAPDGTWRARHTSSDLGEVETRAPTREAALDKMQRELQYRVELCPCSGVSVGTVELNVNHDASQAAR